MTPLILLSSLLVSNTNTNAPTRPNLDVRFSGVCENGEFAAVLNEKPQSRNSMEANSSSLADEAKINSCALADEAKIVFSKLNLHLNEEKGKIVSAECLITSTLPARPGYQISLSEFKAEADAVVPEAAAGFAYLFVSHRFNGEDLDGQSSISRKDGKLVAQQKTDMGGGCGEAATLRTKLTIKAKKAEITAGAENSDSVSLHYRYSPCIEKSENDSEDPADTLLTSDPEAEATAPLTPDPESYSVNP